MRTVVLVAPYFAPSSMPPALRMGHFARHLPEFGWRPIVLTTETEFLEGPLDTGNRELMPAAADVIRTRAIPVGFSRRIGFSDLGIRSLPYQWRALASICKRRRPDLILISVPPNLTMTLGRMAFRRFGIPYVVDYQDPWVIEDYWQIPKSQRPPKWALAYYISRILEPFAIRHASHITGVSTGTTAGIVTRYRHLRQGDATEIPFGAEPADIDWLRENPRTNPIFSPADGLIHVSYAGVIAPAMYENIRAIFQAVRKLIDRRPELRRRLRIHFVGTTYAAKEQPFQVLPLAAGAGLDAIVTEHPGRLSQMDALQVNLNSHALLLVGSNAPHYTASKVFSSILCRRPILAVFHKQSSVVKIMRETQAGHVISFDEDAPPSVHVDAICHAFEEILNWPPQQEVAVDWSAFDQYTSRAMTGRLAQVLDRIADRSKNRLELAGSFA